MTLTQATIAALLIMANYCISLIKLLQEIWFILKQYSFKNTQIGH